LSRIFSDLPRHGFAASTPFFSPAPTSKHRRHFEADGSGRLLNGELRLCRSESHCSDQAFAGATASTGDNNGTFAADIFPASTFTFSLAPHNIFKLDLAGFHNLRASGILRPNSTSVGN
jgi:hypothetical protein